MKHHANRIAGSRSSSLRITDGRCWLPRQDAKLLGLVTASGQKNDRRCARIEHPVTSLCRITNRHPARTGVGARLSIKYAPASRLPFLQRSFDPTAVIRGSFGGVLNQLKTRPHRAISSGDAWRNTPGRNHEGEDRDSPNEPSSGAARRCGVSNRATRNRCTPCAR